MVEQIKQLRVQIDGLAQLTKELKPLRKNNFNFTKEDYSESIDKVNKGISQGFPVNKGIYIVYNNINSKEIEKSVDSLYLAKAWLGKMLSELGTESPYKAGYKTKEDIEPTADVAIALPVLRETFNKERVRTIIDTWQLNGRIMSDYDNFNHIERVDWLRTEIEKCISEVKNYFTFKQAVKLDTEVLTREMSIARTNVYNHLCKARFWLGFELERLKNEK